MIPVLGCAQIVSWGSLFYGFPVFVLPMSDALGWSLPLLNGAATGGLLISGLCAYPVGAMIDRYGGRAIMTGGSLAASLLLVAWSQVAQPVTFYVIWLALGACMAAILYEPAFAVLTQYFGADARRAITGLTLIAGFASTVFIPLIETLLGTLAWRDVLLVLAGLNACICIPIHWWFIPPRPSAHSAREDSTPAPLQDSQTVMRQRLRNPVFWGLTVWFTAWTAGLSGVVFQLVPYLKSSGVETATMLIAIALIGPMQVVGRLVMMFFGERARISLVGALTTALSISAVVVLLISPPELSWLILFATRLWHGQRHHHYLARRRARGVAGPRALRQDYGGDGRADDDRLGASPARHGRHLDRDRRSGLDASGNSRRGADRHGRVLVCGAEL